jgi:hypothetical protein
VIHLAKTGRVVKSIKAVTSIHHKNNVEWYGLALFGELLIIVTKKIART